jgi:hypothetical protein
VGSASAAAAVATKSESAANARRRAREDVVAIAREGVTEPGGETETSLET